MEIRDEKYNREKQHKLEVLLLPDRYARAIISQKMS
jgi:hypothetical protein